VAFFIANQAADSVCYNSLATQGVRLALTLFSRRLRYPILVIAAQIAVPLLVRNLPKVMSYLARKKQVNQLVPRPVNMP
jgi:hypothetical protein